MKQGYGICFNEWIFDKRIRSDLALLTYISSLTAEKGYCFATNKHFSEKFFCDERSIIRKISKFSKLGYIDVSYTEKSGLTEREIRIGSQYTPPDKIVTPPPDKIVTHNNIFSSYEEKYIYLKKIITSYKETTGTNPRETKTLKDAFDVFLRKYQFQSLEDFREQINRAIENYGKEISRRVPGTSYFEHRFSLVEFLSQKNGFDKFNSM